MIKVVTKIIGKEKIEVVQNVASGSTIGVKIGVAVEDDINLMSPASLSEELHRKQ